MEKLLNAVSNNWRAALLAVFVVALLVRGVFVFTLQDGYYFPDSEIYSKAALNLLNHGALGEAYNRPPAYPVFLAAIYLFFGESIFAVRMVESVLGGLLAVMIALIGRRIGGAAVGALSGLLWSIYPLAIFIAGLMYPTGILTALLALGLLCFLPYAQRGEFSRGRLFAAGVLWGLGALAKPTLIATLGAVGLWVLLWGGGRRLAAVALLGLGSALVLVPWGIRDYYTYDRLVIVEPRAVQHLPRMRSADSELREQRVQAIAQYPGEYVFRIVQEFISFWRVTPNRIAMAKPGFREKWHENHPRVVRETIFTTGNLINAVSLLSTGPIFLFAIVGTLAMFFERRRRDLLLLWAVILSFAVTYSFFFAQTRFRIPVEPYIVILGAYGLVKSWEMLAARFARNKVRGSTFEVRSERFEI